MLGSCEEAHEARPYRSQHRAAYSRRPLDGQILATTKLRCHRCLRHQLPFPRPGALPRPQPATLDWRRQERNPHTTRGKPTSPHQAASGRFAPSHSPPAPAIINSTSPSRSSITAMKAGRYGTDKPPFPTPPAFPPLCAATTIPNCSTKTADFGPAGSIKTIWFTVSFPARCGRSSCRQLR